MINNEVYLSLGCAGLSPPEIVERRWIITQVCEYSREQKKPRDGRQAGGRTGGLLLTQGSTARLAPAPQNLCIRSCSDPRPSQKLKSWRRRVRLPLCVGRRDGWMDATSTSYSLPFHSLSSAVAFSNRHSALRAGVGGFQTGTAHQETLAMSIVCSCENKLILTRRRPCCIEPAPRLSYRTITSRIIVRVEARKPRASPFPTTRTIR